MKKNKLMLAAAVVAGGFFAFATQTTAHASAYVRSYQNIKNANATVTNTKAPVWTTASLKHRAGTMRNYGTQVEQYYAAHIRKSNGKAYIYYKFRIGKKTGWVWHGYLKPFTSGTTAPTTGTTGTSTNSGTDLVPVANANWNKIGATGAFAADSTLMQMFPNTIFSKYLYSAVQGYNNIDDGVDRPNYFDTSWSNTMKSKLGVQSTAKPVYIYASVSEPEPFTKANIEAALTKAGYDANARAKFSGWYIGGSIEPDSWADEGAYGGMTTIVLVPQS